MQHAANAVLLPEVPCVHDWQAASKVITPLPGRIAVELDGVREETSFDGGEFKTLYLCDQAAGRWRPDSGTVLAVWEPFLDKMTGEMVECDLKPGDRVLCRAYDGIRVDGFTRGDYTAQGPVKFYGAAWDQDAERMAQVPWWESVVAFIGDDGEIDPCGGMVLVDRELKSHPLLPVELQKADSVGVIVKAGPSSGFVNAVGERIAFSLHENDLLRVMMKGDKTLALVPFDAIQGVMVAA